MKTHLFYALKITMLVLLVLPNLAMAEFSYWKPWTWGSDTSVSAIKGQSHFNLVHHMRLHLPTRQNNLDKDKQTFRSNVRPTLNTFPRSSEALFDQCQQGGSVQCAEQAKKLREETIALIDCIEKRATEFARTQEKINQDAEMATKQCEDYEKRMAALKIDPIEQFNQAQAAERNKLKRVTQPAQSFFQPLFARFTKWFHEKPEHAIPTTIGVATATLFGLRRGLRFFRPIHVHNHTHTTQVAPKA